MSSSTDSHLSMETVSTIKKTPLKLISRTWMCFQRERNEVRKSLEKGIRREMFCESIVWTEQAKDGPGHLPLHNKIQIVRSQTWSYSLFTWPENSVQQNVLFVSQRPSETRESLQTSSTDKKLKYKHDNVKKSRNPHILKSSDQTTISNRTNASISLYSCRLNISIPQSIQLFIGVISSFTSSRFIWSGSSQGLRNFPPLCFFSGTTTT